MLYNLLLLKVTNSENEEFSTDPGIAYRLEPKFNKVCAQEGTRLATPLTEDENKELLNFMKKIHNGQVSHINYADDVVLI